MGYKSLIAKSVNSAFNMAQDLAVSGTFHRRSADTFNFSKDAPVEVTLPDVVGKVLILKDLKNKDGTRKLKLLIKAIDLNLFDTVTINNETWSIGSVIESNRYTTMLEVYRNG